MQLFFLSLLNILITQIVLFTAFNTKLWSKEKAGVLCPNHTLDRSIKTQEGCQALCEAKSESQCVGIVYSHDGGSADYCFLCTNDTTEHASKEYGFYRRPGISKIVSHVHPN